MKDAGSDILENNTGQEAQQVEEAAGGGGVNNTKQRGKRVWRNGKEQRGAKARKAYGRMVHSNTAVQ